MKKNSYEIDNDPEGSLALVQDFIADFNDEEYSASETQNIDLETAI